MRSSARQPHIEAEIEYLTEEAGGRSSPAFSGYRGQFYYGGKDWVAEQTFPDDDRIAPGQTLRVHIRFMSPDKHHGSILEGMRFQIREGSRTVAKGTVTTVFDQLAADAE